MPLPTILTAYNNAVKDIAIVESYRNKSLYLQPDYQGFVAEVLLIRLFSILEKTVCEVSCRIACGAHYKNGLLPSPNIHASSLNDAKIKFENFNRTKSKSCKFTNVNYTIQTISKVITNTEPLVQNLNKFINEFDEMRCVRNHVAHRTSDTRAKFKGVIIGKYGSALKIKVSSFLISKRRERVPVIDQYITIVKLIVDDITKGYV